MFGEDGMLLSALGQYIYASGAAEVRQRLGTGESDERVVAFQSRFQERR